MRVIIHDYSGHPCQAQLSRALASRGHGVTHQYCSSYTTGRGRLYKTPEDSESLDFEDIRMPGTFRRYVPAVRVLQELVFGSRLGAAVFRAKPDVVILSNVPLIAHTVASIVIALNGIPQIFWQQDIYSDGIASAASARLGVAGEIIGRLARASEKLVASLSQSVICISPSFKEQLIAWRIPADKIIVIPNWGPLSEIPVEAKDNHWSRKYELQNREVVLYSGTLGLKHDPFILLEIAEWLAKHRPEARLVVVSEGRGRDWLESQMRDRGQALPQLLLLDFQPYEELPFVLGAADVLLSLLEPDAGRFSIPSKVLSYLCAGRTILGIMPPTNDISDIICAAAGLIVPPGDTSEAIRTLNKILTSPTEREEWARQGRRYAEQAFDIEEIAARFDMVLRDCCSQGSSRCDVSEKPSSHS